MARRARPPQRGTGDGYADRGEVEEFAAGLSMSFLLCRELGHNWKPWVAHWRSEEGCYERALRCTRCKTERWETLSRTGEKLGGQYKYPEGYIHEHLGRIVGDGRDALRLESLHRALSAEELKVMRA